MTVWICVCILYAKCASLYIHRQTCRLILMVPKCIIVYLSTCVNNGCKTAAANETPHAHVVDMYTTRRLWALGLV